MIVKHNIPSLNTNNRLTQNKKKADSTLEKLSSGYKINRAGDDAAGLAISEKMRSQIRGLNMAGKNIQDGISLIQTAESGLGSIQDPNLLRLRELAIQAANDTLTDSDRKLLQMEVEQIKSNIDEIATNTEFNGIKLLNQPNKIEQETIAATQMPGPITWTKSSHGYFMLDIATDGNNFVAVGRDGKTATSSDGVVWNYISKTPTSEVLTSVTSGAGLFVAVGNRATILTSNDGINWTQQNSGLNTNNDFDEIIYDGNKFLALTKDSFDIVTSVDGVNWNIESSGAVGSITYGNGKYVSSGLGEIRISDDGLNWTTSATLDSLGVTDKVQNIIWTGNNFVALTHKNFALISENGINWTRNTVTENNRIGLNEIAWDGNQYIAVGGEPILGGNIGYAFTSLDGIQWFESKIVNNTNTLAGILEQNGRFYVVGNKAMMVGTPSSPITTSTTTTVIAENDMKNINLQVGANSGNTTRIELANVKTETLGINNIDMSTRQGANSAISLIDKASVIISSERAKFGAYQNRLEYANNSVVNTSENLQSAESRIRDTDMAKEMMTFTKNNILSQTTQSMLAQSNKQPEGILQLLQ